jgi:hypothetical protein
MIRKPAEQARFDRFMMSVLSGASTRTDLTPSEMVRLAVTVGDMAASAALKGKPEKDPREAVAKEKPAEKKSCDCILCQAKKQGLDFEDVDFSIFGALEEAMSLEAEAFGMERNSKGHFDIQTVDLGSDKGRVIEFAKIVAAMYLTSKVLRRD